MIDEVKEAAFEWWQQGFNVVSVKIVEDKKQPLVDWGQWHSQRQTEKDFQEMQLKEEDILVPLVELKKIDLKTAAKQYFDMGLPVIPEKIWFSQEDNEWKKTPLCEWKRWETAKQTNGEFESLNWNEANGFAVLAGSQCNDGLFFGCVDFDSKKISQEAIEKGKEVIKNLPTTRVEETVSKGLHLNYLSRKKPRSIKAYHDIAAVELISENCLVVMAPSQGYKALNDNSLTVVEDLETLFFQVLEKTGVKVEKPSQTWFNKAELAEEPYKGKDPPCIRALLKGAREGQRNEFGIRLASYFINFKQYRLETVRKEILKGWNKLNSPELHWKELDAIVKSAVEHGYVYGCYDDILSKFCDRANCSLQPKNEMIFDEETKNKALKLLKDPAFFYKLGKVFECGFTVSKINKPRFVIEEERNKRLLGFLLLGAAKHDMTSIIKVLGEPGTAKDSILRMWLKLLPLKAAERSFFTAATLRYSEQIQNADLLYIPDSPELSGEKGRHLRFMRADDGGLISEYALKDPETGEMTTKTVTLPVKAVATTSNAVTGDTALESGMWTLHTNNSPELTRQVKLEKLKFRAGKRPLFPEDELKVWQCAFWLMLNEEPMEELPKIPFAENLADLLASERSESRRDPDKLCDLISIVAWAKRFQKSKEKWLEADWADLYIALQLGLDAITETISDLDVKEQQIFKAVKSAVAEDVTCKFVTQETGIPYKTCFRLLEKMINKGFLVKDKKQGRNIYNVLKEKEPKNFLIDVDISFRSPEKLLEQVLSLSGDFSSSHQSEKGAYNLTDPLTGNMLTVEFNDGKPTAKVEPCSIVYPEFNNGSGESAVPTPSQGGEKVRSVERSEDKVSDSGNKSSKLISQPMRKDSTLFKPEVEQSEINDALKGSLECPYCKEEGRAMFFATQYDLDKHVSAKHSVKVAVLPIQTEVKDG